MKVKISHTVDLEAVPGEVDKLFSAAQTLMKELEFLAETVAPTADAPHNTVQGIDQMRQILYDIDLALQDCQSIMIDYQTTLAAETVKHLDASLGSAEEHASG
jgi:hypothetical protein